MLCTQKRRAIWQYVSGKKMDIIKIVCLFGWLVCWLGFMTYQPLSVISILIHFYTNNQFYFKQFSLAWMHSLIVNNYFRQFSSVKVLVQTIQFSLSTDFVYAQLNVKTVLYHTNQFSVSKVSILKVVLFQTIQFSIQEFFHFKQFSLA